MSARDDRVAARDSGLGAGAVQGADASNVGLREPNASGEAPTSHAAHVQRFRKKPVVIEAMQFTGDNAREVIAWANAGERVRSVSEMHAPPALAIYTLEGVVKASVGDWIIRGVADELYPCKPDIFEETYEPVS